MRRSLPLLSLSFFLTSISTLTLRLCTSLVRPPAVRRSQREKIPRLDYWRNERIIYKRRSSGIGVNAIVRVPKEDPEPLSGAHLKKKGGAGGKRGASARAGSRGGTVKREVPEEQGVDDMTDPDGLVWSWEGDAEVSRRASSFLSVVFVVAVTPD